MYVVFTLKLQSVSFANNHYYKRTVESTVLNTDRLQIAALIGLNYTQNTR